MYRIICTYLQSAVQCERGTLRGKVVLWELGGLGKELGQGIGTWTRGSRWTREIRWTRGSRWTRVSRWTRGSRWTRASRWTIGSRWTRGRRWTRLSRWTRGSR